MAAFDFTPWLKKLAFDERTNATYNAGEFDPSSVRNQSDDTGAQWLEDTVTGQRLFQQYDGNTFMPRGVLAQGNKVDEVGRQNAEIELFGSVGRADQFAQFMRNFDTNITTDDAFRIRQDFNANSGQAFEQGKYMPELEAMTRVADWYLTKQTGQQVNLRESNPGLKDAISKGEEALSAGSWWREWGIPLVLSFGGMAAGAALGAGAAGAAGASTAGSTSGALGSGLTASGTYAGGTAGAISGAAGGTSLAGGSGLALSTGAGLSASTGGALGSGLVASGSQVAGFGAVGSAAQSLGTYADFATRRAGEGFDMGARSGQGFNPSAPSGADGLRLSESQVGRFGSVLDTQNLATFGQAGNGLVQPGFAPDGLSLKDAAKTAKDAYDIYKGVSGAMGGGAGATASDGFTSATEAPGRSTPSSVQPGSNRFRRGGGLAGQGLGLQYGDAGPGLNTLFLR